MNAGFQWPDYVVFILILVLSLIIGLASGVHSKGQPAITEYLLASRKLTWLPVGLSIIVTFQSAIVFIGVPAEVYTYGHSYMYFHIGMCFAVSISALVFVPLLYPLKLTSVYEYLERRFQSRLVRIIGSLLGMTNMCLYMGVVLFAPATAIEAVSNIPVWMSVLLMSVVATLYTSVGGLRAVVWTDVFQFVIIVIGLVTIFIKGILVQGGLTKVWEVAEQGGHLESVSWSADPRVRHSVWSLLIGGTLTWLSNVGVNQANVQRFSSVPSVNWAKISVLVSVPGFVIFGLMSSVVGLVIYSYYSDQGCDPIKAHIINNQNQLVPLFILTVFTDSPGFTGMFVASLFCASLSTVSSSINSLAAIMWEDLFKWKFSRIKEEKSTKILKLFVVLFGLVAMSVAFLAMQLGGPATQIALAFFGASGGPLLGMFILGAACRRANWIGVSVGAVVSLVICMWLVLGKYTIPPYPSLPGPAGNSCHVHMTIYNVTYHHLEGYSVSPLNTSTVYVDTVTTSIVHEDTVTNDSLLQSFYSISYLWISTIGIGTVLLLGIVVSLLTGPPSDVSSDVLFQLPSCLFCCRRRQSYPVNQGDKHTTVRLESLLHTDS